MIKYGKYLIVITLTFLVSCSDKVDESYCQCVGYVKNELGIPSTTITADAWAWDLSILPAGFYSVSVPKSGDILVMAKGYNGASELYGHIAIVKSVIEYNDNSFSIVMQGANHKLDVEFEYCGCSNVSEWEKTITFDDISTQKAKLIRNDIFSFKCFDPN